MSNNLTAAGQEVISEGKHWGEDRAKRARDWGRLGWYLAITFGLLFVFSVITGFVVWMKMAAPVAPNVLAVDHATGEVQVLELFGEKAVSNNELVHKLFAKTYVETCERYESEQINNDYAACADMSEGEALSKYQKIFTGADARHLKLRNLQKWTIDVLNVQLPPDAAGIAIVRFKKTIWIGGSASAEGYFTARFAYRFAEIPKGTEREKISNPYSFKVRSYIADTDMTASQTSAPGTVPAMVPATH